MIVTMWTFYFLMYAVVAVMVIAAEHNEVRSPQYSVNINKDIQVFQEMSGTSQDTEINQKTVVQNNTSEAVTISRARNFEPSQDNNMTFRLQDQFSSDKDIMDTIFLQQNVTSTYPYEIEIDHDSFKALPNSSDQHNSNFDLSEKYKDSYKYATNGEHIQQNITPTFSNNSRSFGENLTQEMESNINITNVSYETSSRQQKNPIKQSTASGLSYQNNSNKYLHSESPNAGHRSNEYRVNFQQTNQRADKQESSINNRKSTNGTDYFQLTTPTSLLESIIGHGRRNHEVLLKLLKHQDAELNDSLAITLNYTEHFLNFGDLDVGQNVLNLTKQYVERRRDWIHYMKLLPPQNKNFSDIFLRDGSLLENRVKQLGEMESTLTKLKNVYRIATIINDTNEINCFNSFESFNYTGGEILLRETEKYLNDLDLAINDLKKMWDRYNLTGYFRFPWDNSSHFISDTRDCLDFVNSTIQEDHQNKLRRLELEEIFRYYTYPGVYIAFLVLGVIGNGALLFMFARHKELRTTPNIMVFNLAIADVLNLFANTPLYYVSKYYSHWIYLDGYGCRLFVTFRFLNHAVIELSIVALSAQRYCATVTTLRKASKRWRLSAHCRTVTYILSVWLVSLIFALPPSIVFDYRNGVCFPFVKSQIAVEILEIFYFIFFCFFLPATMGVFSIFTAKKLRMSVRNIPGVLHNSNREVARYRSAKVVTALAVAYAVSHMPRSIWFFLVSYFHLDRRALKYIIIDEVTNYLIFSNSCLNPLALYIASETFRRLFKRYLFCCPQSDKSRNGPLERKTTASSSTRLVYIIESISTEMNGSKGSVKDHSIKRKYSNENVNINPSV